MKKVRVVMCSILLLWGVLSHAQQTIATATNGIVPPLVNFSGVLTDASGKALTSTVSVTFSLYKEQTGGSPVWMETQNILPDGTGHYVAMLGSTSSAGLPSSIFTTGEAHWLAVQAEGQAEQARVLLVSAPYALKAGDAETIGGLPPSAFLMAPSAVKSGATASGASTTASALGNPAAPPATVTGSGTTNFIPKWTGASTVGNSVIFQSGSGSTAKVGINNSAPTLTLDVKGEGKFVGSTSTNVLLGSQTGNGAAGNGVVGLTSSTGGFGVYGFANNTTGTAIGVNGVSSGTSGTGVYGTGANGVVGLSTICCVGAGGKFTGFSAPNNSSLVGETGIFAYGGHGDTQDVGSAGGDGIVSYGGSGKAQFSGKGGYGIRAFGGDGYGDVGDGVGGSFTGANGAFQDGDGVDAFGGSGVGVFAVGGIGNSSNGSTEGDGIDAYPGDPSDSGSYAGYFVGNVWVTGAITAGTKDFKIDHPQDPENKYLVHASVESSEMMNIYTGNVTTDGTGSATVRLPKWFESLNGDFRYQLTAIGQFAQAIVANEINQNQFSIRTDKPNVKVSWQVTAVRHDAYAKAHPMVVEEAKEAKLRGFYIHPELYGAPADKQIDRARHPQAMKRAKAARAQAAAAKAAVQAQTAAELR
jgi:hypothetical protein